MSLDELCREYAVIVAEGSGVIFQPMSDEYTYILTAKHVVSEDDKDEDDNYVVVNKDEIKIKIDGIDNIIVSGVYPHSFLDIAILKINKIDKRTPLKEFEQISENDNKYHLYGFPAYKRSVKESFDKKIQDIDLKYNKVNRYEISFDNTHRIKYKGISGYSGGGVFLEKNSEVYLIGIEYAMTDMEEEAPLYRIQAVDIMAFDEIIEENELAPFLSPNLNSFEYYKEDLIKIFSPEIRSLLDEEVNDILSKDVNPYKIIKNLEAKLFYPKTHSYKGYLDTKELWEGWLFYLILLNIYLDRKHNIHDFIKINDKNIYCLFCDNDKNDINKMISNILREDNEFNTNSTILFNTKNNVRNKDYCYYSKNIPNDIANVYSLNDDDKMRINQAIKQKKISFILLDKIKNKVGEINNTTRDEIKEIIRKDILCERSIFEVLLDKLGSIIK